MNMLIIKKKTATSSEVAGLLVRYPNATPRFPYIIAMRSETAAIVKNAEVISKRKTVAPINSSTAT